MVFHWSLKWHQVSLRLPELFLVFWPILVVWMASTRPPIFSSSGFLNKPLGTVPSSPVIIGMTVTFMLFFKFFGTVQVVVSLFFFSFLSFFFCFFDLQSVVRWGRQSSLLCRLSLPLSLFYLFFYFLLSVVVRELGLVYWFSYLSDEELLLLLFMDAFEKGLILIVKLRNRLRTRCSCYIPEEDRTMQLPKHWKSNKSKKFLVRVH